MTDEWYSTALDASPSDSACRLLFAEHLSERGDGDAKGVAWMARRAKRPYGTGVSWNWWASKDNQMYSLGRSLKGGVRGQAICVVFGTRRAAESALCRAVEGSDEG